MQRISEVTAILVAACSLTVACSSTPGPDTRAGQPPASATTAPPPGTVPSPVPAELGAANVRAVTAESVAPDRIRLVMMGLEGAVYGYRDAAGNTAQCTQVDRGTHAPPAGMPAVASRRTEVTCDRAGPLAPGSRVLVALSRGTFDYAFEVPALS